MPKKQIAITGATGFIGAAIVRELLSSGDSVIALLRPNSDVSRLDDIKEDIQFESYDLLKEDALKSKFSADVFIHCAWRGVAGEDRNEEFQIKENVPSVIKSVELASKLGCTQWIGLGSQAEYGNLNNKIDESSPTMPTTAYGKAKLAGGVAALGLCEVYGMAGSWLRIFSTYGPGDAPHWFIPHIIGELLAGRSPKLTKCEQLWDYLYVDDAARAVAAVARQTDAKGFFNLGSGSPHPLKTYVEAIRTLLKSNLIPDYGAVPYRPDQVMHLEANIDRLVGLTGWTPLVNFSEGLANMIEHAKSTWDQ